MTTPGMADSLPAYTDADMTVLAGLQYTDGVRLAEAPRGVPGWREKRSGAVMVLQATRAFELGSVVLRELPLF
jgi:hypothetical protein